MSDFTQNLCLLIAYTVSSELFTILRHTLDFQENFLETQPFLDEIIF